ncbi:RidA family protein [Caballeronia sp.]|uniref:RidA family protein n=1 Tax=Caballeronia sp. TaxID=1931223 RepID=UPI003C67747E
MRQLIEVPVLSPALRAMGIPLSLVTKGAGQIFVSGLPPFDVTTGQLVKGDIETQTEASLIALAHCLKAAGASLDDVLMVRIYAANSGHYGAINRVYARHFPQNPPARTFVPVASWPNEFDIEIECTAMIR